MSKCVKKCLLIGASTLMFLSAGGSFINNSSVNARHRRTHRVYRHRHYRYHTSLRHNAWLSGRYYGKKKEFSRHLHYYKADRKYFRKGWIIGYKANSNANYRQAGRRFNQAYRASGDEDGNLVIADNLTNGYWTPY